MREEWVNKRKNDEVKTQMYYAKKGIITEEMSHIAKKEKISAELVKNEVKRGRMIIPANVNHHNLDPMAIGIAASCKINANIGSSAIASDVKEEVEKLEVCLKYGADTVMDLSTGGNLDEIREAIIKHSTVPIGTVPIYQILHDVKNKIERLNIETMLEVLERQAKQGVSYFTIHAGFFTKVYAYGCKKKNGDS